MPWLTARKKRVLVALALFIGAAFVGCSPLTSRILLYPPSGARSIDGEERVMLPDADGAIETIRAKSPGALIAESRAIVLRFYGNADRAEGQPHEEAAAFGDWPVEIWGVNYPGYGQSEGGVSLSGVARAADVALAEAEKSHLPIFAMGTSMGTTAALHLGATGKLRGIFLQNPPPLPELIRGQYGWWNLWLLAVPISWGVPSSLDSIGNAKHTSTPIVFVSSQSDEVVPFEYQTTVYEACAGQKERIVVPGAHHNSPLEPHTWSEILTAMRRFGWQ